MRFTLGLFVSFLCTFVAFSQTQDQNDESLIISVDTDVVETLKNDFRSDWFFIEKRKDVSIVRTKLSSLPKISHMMHEKFHRCGGFVVESSYNDTLKIFKKPLYKQQFAGFAINQPELVNEALVQVSEDHIRETIVELSSFQNRYYRSEHGVASQKWLYEHWSDLLRSQEGVNAQLYNHESYPQPSVIVTIKGSTHADEQIVIGGHGDSIAGWRPSNEVEAPGADDNASGIATITEVIRVLAEMNFRPKRTLHFMSYAAEEVGLRGSNDIASRFRDERRNVVGVLQLDMTNFTENPQEIVLMTDYTNVHHNQFLKNLSQNYLAELQITEDRCGYACSDHVSWFRNGYPVSFPFESRMSQYNHKIHTAHDTIEVSNDGASHASHFAKLVLAYILEAQP